MSMRQPVNESDWQIPRFASLKNDDEYDSDKKALMPMQEDDDSYIENINSDNERDSNVDNMADQNSDDDSASRTLNDDSSTISNDEEEEEQHDFDEWFEEQMDIHENTSEKSTVKEGEHYTRLGSHIKFKVVEGEVNLKSNEDWKGCITKDTFTSFLSGYGDVQGIL